jgi:branched-chain amino acid transport system substrate-binding protein
VDTGLFTPLSNDFTAQITMLKAAQCDIVTGVFLPPDFATFWAQCAQQGFTPKAVTVAKALLFPALSGCRPRNGGRRIIRSSRA